MPGLINKKIEVPVRISVVIVAFLAVAALGMILYANRTFLEEHDRIVKELSTLEIPKSKYAFIEIDFGNGKKRRFEGNLHNAVYEFPIVFKTVAEVGKFSYRLHDGGVEHINGINGPWKVYRNGVLATAPPHKLMIQAGDNYTLVRSR